MMKRTLFLLVALIMVLTLAGCGSQMSINETDEDALEELGFKQIDGEKTLVYNVDTKSIYYMFSTKKSSGYQGYGYMAPYISENGKYCKYINDEIVEIIEEETDN